MHLKYFVFLEFITPFFVRWLSFLYIYDPLISQIPLVEKEEIRLV